MLRTLRELLILASVFVASTIVFVELSGKYFFKDMGNFWHAEGLVVSMLIAYIVAAVIAKWLKRKGVI